MQIHLKITSSLEAFVPCLNVGMSELKMLTLFGVSIVLYCIKLLQVILDIPALKFCLMYTVISQTCNSYQSFQCNISTASYIGVHMWFVFVPLLL